MTHHKGRDRRDFLKKCGRFAAVTPPSMTFLLSTSLKSRAIAASAGKGVHSGGQSGPGQSLFGWTQANNPPKGPPASKPPVTTPSGPPSRNK